MLNRSLAMAVVSVIGSLALMAAAPSDDELRATAETWLTLVDNHNYAESWNEGSSAFRAQVTQQKWSEAMQTVREPLGTMISRKFIRVTKAKSLPGAPDGDYAVIQFQSSFTSKASAVETVTLALEEGKWKTAGYFIR
jgi:hypothetical protein